jgi:diguanylate cyclase (GGDEF)-like protein
MMGFGFLIGVIFPFFVYLVGIPSHMVLTPWFFFICIAAGILVGGINFFLAKLTIGGRLRLLSRSMRFVQTRLHDAITTGHLEGCTPEECLLEIDSDDELGESAQAFNLLIEALSASKKTEVAVREFSEMLTSELDLEALSAQALKLLMQQTEADAGAIFIETESEMVTAASHAIRSPNSIVSSDHIREALKTKKRQIISLPQNLTLQGVLVNFHPQEIIIDPLVHKQALLGAIVLASTTVFPEHVRTRLVLFKQSLALALNNALDHERLQRLAAIDPLTGLYNRRFGMARLREEFSRAVRQKVPLGVLMFDIDHFKKVNDTHGHLIGDRILTQVSAICRSAVREGDIVMRYGGEEFLAILPVASKENITEIGERIRRIIEETQFDVGTQLIQITISIGGAAYPGLKIETESDLVKCADEAMYSAKNSGRNYLRVA